MNVDDERIVSDLVAGLEKAWNAGTARRSRSLLRKMLTS